MCRIGLYCWALPPAHVWEPTADSERHLDELRRLSAGRSPVRVCEWWPWELWNSSPCCGPADAEFPFSLELPSWYQQSFLLDNWEQPDSLYLLRSVSRFSNSILKNTNLQPGAGLAFARTYEASWWFMWLAGPWSLSIKSKARKGVWSTCKFSKELFFDFQLVKRRGALMGPLFKKWPSSFFKCKELTGSPGCVILMYVI